MTTAFRTTRRVEFADTDMAGIVHFSNFFRFMESAEVDLLHSLGLSVKMEWEGQHLGFPRVSASCDFLRPVTFEDVLEVLVTVERVGRKSVSYSFEFLEDKLLVARGKVTSVCCRVLPDRSLESVELPATLRQRLEESRHARPEPGEGL
jgi:YbgC/YbaW family acyl-CoA thioester hydrolase